jgi:3-oxoacyl-[acyl-carrier protein] reductase
LSNFHVDLSGKAAIITGAGAGFGRATALALSAAGASVLINDLNPDRADDVVDEIHAQGGQAAAFQADVCNRFQAAATIETARESFGRIELLINAAGTFKAGDALSVDEWDWRRLLDVNITGTFFMSQLMGRVMRDEGGGTMINFTSNNSLYSTRSDGVGYAASKAGIVGLTRQLATEYAPYKIRVNAVCVGGLDEDDMPAVDASQIPLGRATSADDVANAVLFLCSDAAAFITGQTLTVDGGLSLR